MKPSFDAHLDRMRPGFDAAAAQLGVSLRMEARREIAGVIVMFDVLAPDLVPAVQKVTNSVMLNTLTDRNPWQRCAERVNDLFDFVAAEREARQWSACDI